jgi:HAD superfamily hydrolase (TIGR01509 family)
MKKMVLFDWNGTLIADMPIWRKSIEKIFELHDVKPPSNEEYFKKAEEFGNFEKIYQSLGINLSRKELDKIYHGEYQRHFDEIELSSGVKKTLASLKQKRIIMGIVTIQLKSLLDPLFSKFGLKEYFDEVITDATKKNTLIVHLYILRKVKPQNCYYVGDSPSDIRQAKNAGVKSIAYLHGYIPKELMLAAKPDFVISDFKEIEKIVKK